MELSGRDPGNERDAFRTAFHFTDRQEFIRVHCLGSIYSGDNPCSKEHGHVEESDGSWTSVTEGMANFLIGYICSCARWMCM